MNADTSSPPPRAWWRRLWLLPVVALIIAGCLRVSFQVEISALLPPDLKEARGLQMFIEHFSHRDEVILLVESGDAKATAAAVDAIRDGLRARADLTKSVLDRPPIEDSADATAELLAFAWVNQPPEKFTALEARLAPDAVGKGLSALQEEMATGIDSSGFFGYDPLKIAGDVYEGLASGQASSSVFASADGTSKILFVQSATPFADYREAGTWTDVISTEVDKICEQHPGVTWGMTGQPAFEAQVSRVMQRDMMVSGFGSLILTAGIFWLFYRSFRPLLLVVAALGLIALLALAAGGFLLPGLNVMTAGFAGILVGLAVDYGILLYQESLDHKDAASTRKAGRHSILAAALTTAAAFGALGVSDVPGVSQLGRMVGLGILIGAAVMLGPFTGWLFAGKSRPPVVTGQALSAWLGRPGTPRLLATGAALVCTASLLGLAFKGMPGFDTSMAPMKLEHCPAQVTLDRASRLLGSAPENLQILCEDESDSAMAHRLASLADTLTKAKTEGLITEFNLPAALWPSPERQQANLSGPAARLSADAARLKTAVTDAGFEDLSWELTGRVLTFWQDWAAAGKVPVQPQTPAARWLLGRFAKSTDDAHYALATVVPADASPEVRKQLATLISADGQYLLNESVLGDALSEKVPAEMMRILTVLAVGVLLFLSLSLRRVSSVALCVGVMGVNLVVLLGLMSLLGWTWNFFNIGALLLALGAGIDYSIHMLVDLQRHGGDTSRTLSTTGRALMGCCLTTAAGFGSLATAEMSGLASLGMIAALSLLVNLMIALCFLPLGWRWLNRRRGR